MAFTPATNFIRVERQTLRRLPKTGGIVFSIRIYADPLATLMALGDGGQMAQALAERSGRFHARAARLQGHGDQSAMRWWAISEVPTILRSVVGKHPETAANPVKQGV
jgi:hypothetical protein